MVTIRAFISSIAARMLAIVAFIMTTAAGKVTSARCS
jgi:hypothetical protein